MECVQMTILRKFGFERGEKRGEGADKMLAFVGEVGILRLVRLRHI